MASLRYKVAAINFSSSGDNTVITAPASGGITVVGITFTVAGGTNITFKNGTTAESGAIVFTGNGSSMTLMNHERGYYFADAGNNFVMNNSNAVQVSGTIWYTLGG
jgi:hypothetical protein